MARSHKQVGLVGFWHSEFNTNQIDCPISENQVRTRSSMPGRATRLEFLDFIAWIIESTRMVWNDFFMGYKSWYLTIFDSDPQPIQYDPYCSDQSIVNQTQREYFFCKKDDFNSLSYTFCRTHTCTDLTMTLLFYLSFFVDWCDRMPWFWWFLRKFSKCTVWLLFIRFHRYSSSQEQLCSCKHEKIY